jgi:predicted nucleotidyltransferase
MYVDLPREVAEILGILVLGIQEAVGSNVEGVYLRGSLATGDFDQVTSDVDFFVVTERPVSEAEFDRLTRLHKRLAEHPNRYGDQLEGAYLSRDSARRFRPGERHPTVYRGEAFGWREHKSNWVLERRLIREHGMPLLGPDPNTLIDPISVDEVREAVRAVLRDWVEWAGDPDDPDWLLPLSHKAYVIETMCRALYTLDRGELPGKPRAVAWALELLHEPWRSLVERSQQWRTDDTSDSNAAPDVASFIYWTASGGHTRGAEDVYLRS